MQQVTPVFRRDPAPSRVAYRLHRLWLTPFFRALLRVGLPAFALAFGVGLFLSDAGRRAMISEKLAEVQQSFQERPAFMVHEVSVEGATVMSGEAVLALLPENLPKSSFDLNLDALRADLLAVDAVADAELRLRIGGVLDITIVERKPAVLERVEDRLTVRDASGRRISEAASRAEYPELPLVAGAGAAAAVGEARLLWAAAAPIADRVRGLVRVGERRWDLVLSRGQRVLLPETDPVSALERMIALDQARDVLAREITVVDLRNPQRPTLRITPPALEELRHIRTLERETLVQ
jgi:cell division protein FtsQ